MDVYINGITSWLVELPLKLELRVRTLGIRFDMNTEQGCLTVECICCSAVWRNQYGCLLYSSYEWTCGVLYAVQMENKELRDLMVISRSSVKIQREHSDPPAANAPLDPSSDNAEANQWAARTRREEGDWSILNPSPVSTPAFHPGPGITSGPTGGWLHSLTWCILSTCMYDETAWESQISRWAGGPT